MSVEDSEKIKRIVNNTLISLFLSILLTGVIMIILVVLFPKVLDHKYKNYGIALFFVICFALIYRQYDIKEDFSPDRCRCCNDYWRRFKCWFYAAPPCGQNC